MAYSDFTLNTVRDVLGLSIRQEGLFPDVQPIEPSPWLREALVRGLELPRSNERARSEFMVVPVLLESRALSGGRITIYSGEALNVDRERGLVGECDYLISLLPPLPILQAPSGVVLEAKGGLIEASMGQCAAQMVGAQLFNQKQGKSVSPIFGCVTSGTDWQFLHLAGAALVIDPRLFYLNEITTLLGIFQTMIAACQPDTAAA